MDRSNVSPRAANCSYHRFGSTDSRSWSNRLISASIAGTPPGLMQTKPVACLVAFLLVIELISKRYQIFELVVCEILHARTSVISSVIAWLSEGMTKAFKKCMDRKEKFEDAGNWRETRDNASAAITMYPAAGKANTVFQLVICKPLHFFQFQKIAPYKVLGTSTRDTRFQEVIARMFPKTVLTAHSGFVP